MIDILVFITLTIVAFASLIYSVIDYQNKMYAHIAMAFVAGFTFMYLGIAVGSGIVYDPSGTAGNTDASSSILFQFFSMVAWVYTLLMGTMAYFTWQRTKANRIATKQEEWGS